MRRGIGKSKTEIESRRFPVVRDSHRKKWRSARIGWHIGIERLDVDQPDAFRGRNSTWPISDTQNTHCARLEQHEKDNITFVCLEKCVRCTIEAVEKRALDWRLREIRKKLAVVANPLGGMLRSRDRNRDRAVDTE